MLLCGVLDHARTVLAVVECVPSTVATHSHDHSYWCGANAQPFASSCVCVRAIDHVVDQCVAVVHV